MCWLCWEVTSVTLSKLSLRNARRQASDYLVYFVTIIMAAALVYAFNGLVFSQELRNLSGMMDSLPIIIALASVVVVCVIGWLVHYTTGFMLARRSRELGTYILIGLENRQVAMLFFQENLAVGGIALVLGILLGNLLFQVLRAVTLALFHIPYIFRFSFSFKAVGLTIFYFAIVYLFALFCGRKRIRNMKICDLIYYDRKNEGELIKRGRRRQKTFAMSIVFGILGTALLLLQNLSLGILGAGFIILFLYGFFISFSSGVPAYFERHISHKYRSQTLLIFRSLSSKLATMGVVMATIALLFTATILSEGSGMLFSALFQSRTAQTTSFDLFISSTGRDEAPLSNYLAYIDTNIPIKDAWQYPIYKGESLKVTDYIETNIKYWSNFDYDTLMKASDYTALRKMLGYPEVTIEPGKYYIHCMPYLKGLMEEYSDPLTVDGNTLLPGGVSVEVFTQSLWDGNGRGFILVIPDAAAAPRPVSHYVYAAMTAEPVSKAHYAALCGMRDENDVLTGYDAIFSKADVEEENASLCATIVFPLFYLALVLTMVSATILTIHQLSETGRYRQQFQLLHKLGMDRREMKQTLRRQFAIYYTMPAVPPLLISIPFILGLGSSFDPGTLAGPGQLFIIVGVTLFLFFTIYLLYIMMAYTSLKRNVLPE